MVMFGLIGCIRAKVVFYGKKFLYSVMVVVFGQTLLYSGKTVLFGQSGCIRANCFYPPDVVVFG